MSIEGTYDNENIFNKILRGDAPCVKVYEDDKVLAFMDIFPESRGHTLVVPKVNARNFLDLPREWVGPYLERVQMLTSAVQRALNPAGIRVMQYNGAEATQTVYHVHFHIVPCYEGEALAEHSSVMAKAEDLQQYADKIIEAMNSIKEV